VLSCGRDWLLGAAARAGAAVVAVAGKGVGAGAAVGSDVIGLFFFAECASSSCENVWSGASVLIPFLPFVATESKGCFSSIRFGAVDTCALAFPEDIGAEQEPCALIEATSDKDGSNTSTDADGADVS